VTRRTLGLIGVVILAAVARVSAQTVEAQRFRLSTGPCVISSGSGAPIASAGLNCDSYFNTATGDLWVKIAGVWKQLGNIGSGTPGTLSKWATASTLADSLLSESGSAVSVNGSIGSPSYASQVSGWRITQAGAADVRFLFTDELRARVFTADAESVLAGSQRVTKSYSTIAQTFTCPAAAAAVTLWVNDAPTFGDAPVFQTNDWIVIHTLTRTTFGPFTIADCVGVVTGYVDGSGANAGQQSWTFTRGSGASGGTMTSGTTVAVNQLAQDLGVSGNGFVETTAVDGPNNGNAPYTQVVTWTGAPTSANLVTRCRLGNQQGLTSILEYGVFCGTPGGTYFKFTDQAAMIHNMPLRLGAGGVDTLALDPTAPSFAMGNPLPTSFAGANSGVWMGNDAGTYKLRIGGAAGNRLQWDGTTLSVSGEGSGVTNINGGSIQTGTVTATQIASATITSTQIAANTITVGNLIATGFGDNLIKNGTFEGDGLAGWAPDYLAGGTVGLACCGTRGPGAAILTVSGTLQIGMTYLAVPIQQGITYRVALDTYGAAVGAGVYVRMWESTSTATPRRVANNPGPGDIAYTTVTDLCANCAQAGGWQHREYVYTPTSGTTWASLGILNTTCPQSTCNNLYIDAVEMQPQIGPGHIKANSITADRLVANSITSAQIAAGTITAANIASGTITTTQIAANTITGGNIAGSTITGGNIAGSTITGTNIAGGTITGGNISGGTITGGNIAGNTITADKLTVTSLSAISANLGTINAGTINGIAINGSTITASCATMDANGFSLTAGGSTCQWYKWNNSQVGMNWDGGAWFYIRGSTNLEMDWGNNQIFFQNVTQGAIRITNWQGYGNRYVCVDNSGNLYLGTGGAASSSC